MIEKPIVILCLKVKDGFGWAFQNLHNISRYSYSNNEIVASNQLYKIITTKDQLAGLEIQSYVNVNHIQLVQKALERVR